MTSAAILLGGYYFPSTVFGSSIAFTRSHEQFRKEIIEGLLSIKEADILDLFDSHDNNSAQLAKCDRFLRHLLLDHQHSGSPQRLLIYYVGHGGFDREEYCLAIRSSKSEGLARTSIRFRDLATLIQSHADSFQSFIFVDACFAAKGTAYFLSAADHVVTQQYNDTLGAVGVCLYCSSSSDQVSYLLPDNSGTAFTKALCNVMRQANEGSTVPSLRSIHNKMPAALGKLKQDNLALEPTFAPPSPQLHTPVSTALEIADVPFFVPSNRSISAEASRQHTATTSQMGTGSSNVKPRNADFAKYQTTFLQSIISAKEFGEVGVVFNPYSEFLDPTEPQGIDKVTIYLWLPEPAVFAQRLAMDVTIVSICDAGPLEFHRKQQVADLEFLNECYRYSPSRLTTAKRHELIEMIGEILRGTFVLAAVVPKFMLGDGLKSPELSYRSLLNIVFLPLVAAHSQIGFRRMTLTTPVLDDYVKDIESQSKRIMRSTFQQGNYNFDTVELGKEEFFYVYAARFIAWAVGKHGRGEGTWLESLNEAFVR